ncbi:MAG: glycosyltransferase [Clostridia bacterium]|nr:glycosyltransferase [Clostridia bacterium]
MKVLILTISAGQGHNQTSKAMKEYFDESKIECNILDAYEFMNPLLADAVEKGYLFSTKYIPKPYGGVYRLYEKNIPTIAPGFGRTTNRMFGQKLVKYIAEYGPSAVICTHPFAALFVTYYNYKKKLPPFLSFGIITDFTVHPFWDETMLDYYVIPDALLTNQVKKKLPVLPEQVLPFGIPISTKFASSMGAAEARAKLGLENIMTILVMMGSMGFGNIAKLIREMDLLDGSFQIVVVCGKNERAQRRLKHENFRHKTHVLGYIDYVDILMDASTFIITKPGGLTTSESLAKKLPMILTNPIPGQEDRNMEFLLNNGAAMSVSHTFHIDDAVYCMINAPWRLKAMTDAAGKIGKPNSAQTLGEFIAEKVKEK